MTKTIGQSESRSSEADRLYERADEEWSRGRLRSAFRLFLAAARAGKIHAFYVVGQFYAKGEGVEADKHAAIYWYRRAYRHGSDAAANNIGCILRDSGNNARAISWFKRAVKLGDGNANFNIARIYLKNRRTRQKGIQYLEETCKSDSATEGAKEEALLLLKEIKRRQK